MRTWIGRPEVEARVYYVRACAKCGPAFELEGDDIACPACGRVVGQAMGCDNLPYNVVERPSGRVVAHVRPHLSVESREYAQSRAALRASGGARRKLLVEPPEEWTTVVVWAPGWE